MVKEIKTLQSYSSPITYLKIQINHRLCSYITTALPCTWASEWVGLKAAIPESDVQNLTAALIFIGRVFYLFWRLATQVEPNVSNFVILWTNSKHPNVFYFLRTDVLVHRNAFVLQPPYYTSFQIFIYLFSIPDSSAIPSQNINKQTKNPL